MEEFMFLRQGSSSVEDYYQDFLRLSVYAPDLVNTEEKKAERFVQGLRPAMRSVLSVVSYAVFEDVYNAALRHERSVADKAGRDYPESSRANSGTRTREYQPRVQPPYRRGGRRGTGRRFDRRRAPAAPALPAAPQVPAPLMLPAPVAAQQLVDY